jgi:hypothetical protein
MERGLPAFGSACTTYTNGDIQSDPSMFKKHRVISCYKTSLSADQLHHFRGIQGVAPRHECWSQSQTIFRLWWQPQSSFLRYNICYTKFATQHIFRTRHHARQIYRRRDERDMREMQHKHCCPCGARKANLPVSVLSRSL